MSEIDIFRDFKDYACDECVENYDECDDDDCWAKIMYKQLKRLQEEKEECRKIITEMTESFAKLYSERDNALQELVLANSEKTRLQQENYELKESLKVFQRPDIQKVLTLYRTGEIERLEQENERLKEEVKEQEDLANECLGLGGKYLQALEEIREIAKRAFIVCDDECGNANKFAEIQDKISEVLK